MPVLTVWSFLVASAHGAGLMVVPFALGAAAATAPAPSAHHHAAALPGIEGAGGALATLLHTAGYLGLAGAVAWLVYRKLGLRLLRSAWVNLNLVWAVALIVTAVLTPLL